MVASKNSSKSSAAVDPKLEALRHQMASAEGGAGVDAYIIPSEDPHMVSSLPRPLQIDAEPTYCHHISDALATLNDGDTICIC